MYTIGMLRRTLGLSSDNQVRNRLEAIKDLLSDHTRRGPNNQIFLTEEGLGLMRRLQEYHEAGLTLTEASHMMSVTSRKKSISGDDESVGFAPNHTKQSQAMSTEPERPMDRELAALGERVARLTEYVRTAQGRGTAPRSDDLWWMALREDVDVP